jgi:endonuclease III-like uncharacterized protein
MAPTNIMQSYAPRSNALYRLQTALLASHCQIVPFPNRRESLKTFDPTGSEVRHSKLLYMQQNSMSGVDSNSKRFVHRFPTYATQVLRERS